jgi:hypothetical protein
MSELTDIQVLKDTLAAQHPLHAIMGEVFEDLGGAAFIKEWAEDHPGQFLGYLFRSTPNIAPTQGMTGDVNIIINNALQPTALDMVTLDEQGRVIEHAV